MEQIIIAVINGVISVVMIIIGVVTNRKIDNKTLNDLKNYVNDILPFILNQTESLKGADVKKNNAIAIVTNSLTTKFGDIKKTNLDEIISYTSKQIENILSTPQKKEEK